MKRLVSLFTICLLVLSLAACGGTASPAPGAATQGSADVAAPPAGKGRDDAPVPLKWLTTGDAGAKPMVQNDRIIAKINQDLGIDLAAQIVPEGNVEKINVAMASSDFPDIVTGQYGNSATQQWITNGMVIDLAPYFAENPHLKSSIVDDYDWTATDGKYFGVPFITQYNAANALVIFRQDWLDTLSLPYPETLEAMRTTLIAFTTDDPDGNGQDDTFGYTSAKPSGNTQFEWVFGALGRAYGDYALDAQGNVIPWFEGGYFVPGMTYIKELWDSGAIDSELFLNDNPKKEEKFYQGKSGAMLAPLFRHVTRHENNLRQVFPDATIAYGLPPKGADGSFGLNAQGKSGMYTCITAACKNPEKAAQFLDLMVSDEGNDLLRLGIEGIHYTKEGDTITFNDDERTKDAFSDNGWAHPLAWGSFFWPLESDYLPVTEPAAQRALETVALASQAQLPNLIKQKTPLEIKNGGAVSDIFTQYYSDMLQGKIGIEEGAAKLSDEWRSQGGDEILAEANAVHQATK